jgi:hypothetical protein
VTIPCCWKLGNAYKRLVLLANSTKACMVIKPTKIAFALLEMLKCGKGNEEKLSHCARTQTED